MACECLNWVRGGDGRILASHAATCPNYDPVGDCLEHIHALLMAMDEWADDEDGIHPDVWDRFEAARAFIGQPIANKRIDGESGFPYEQTKSIREVQDGDKDRV